MHVGAALRLLLLILLLDDSPVSPGTRIQGDPLLPPCGTGVSHGRALGDPMHPGGASLGVLLVRAIPSQEIPREAEEALEGGTVGQGDPLARDPQRSLVKGVCQGDPIAAPPFSPPVSGCRGDPLAQAGGVVELRVLSLSVIILTIALIFELGLTPFHFPAITPMILLFLLI